TTWSPIFDGYLEEIKRIHNRMMGQQEFIAARFAEITPAIEIKKISGKKIEVCSHCNMASAEITKQNSWGNEYQCLVCGVKDV
ncbi:hypothetical protein, partial [Streptomyces sp. P17]